MKKWIRNYRAEFLIGKMNENREFVQEDAVTIEYPVSCSLEIDLGALASNGCRGAFQFYNLPPDIRTRLWLDLWEIGKKTIIVKFCAGYQNVMPLVFQGSLMECTSQKPGEAVDWITSMWGYVSTILEGYTFLNQTASKGTKIEDILDGILKKVPDIKLGYVSPSIPPLYRNRTFIGQTLDLLGREYGGYDIVIDKGELSIVDKGEVLPGDILVITAESGLLGSPRRSNVFVEVDMLFEPGLKIVQAVELLSDSMPQYNNLYKVIRLQHKGMISPVNCGKLITTVTLELLQEKPKVLEKAVPTTYQGQATTGRWLKPVTNGAITSPYGWRYHPIDKKNKFHSGIDIGAGYNAQVVAPANGQIVYAGWYNGYGRYIKINHGKDSNGNVITSAYGHLNKISVNVYQTVNAGQEIGRVGSTGDSTGPHLHFEIRKNDIAVNPLQYIGNY